MAASAHSMRLRAFKLSLAGQIDSSGLGVGWPFKYGVGSSTKWRPVYPYYSYTGLFRAATA
jgi:hypothetical protein